MNVNDRCLFAGQIVTIRGAHNHSVTGKVRYLVEHSDGSYSKVGAESLALLDAEPEPQPLGSVASFHRQPAKLKRVLK